VIILLPSTSVTVIVTAANSNTSANTTVTVGPLPTGITTTASFPLTIPPEGSPITFQASPTISTGNYKITLTGQAGSLTTSTTIPITVQTVQPESFQFIQSLFSELAVSDGSSAQMKFNTAYDGAGNTSYTVALSLSGLPPGTSATISPTVIAPGQTVTVTVSASGSAPVSQNTQVTLTGTADVPVPQETISFSLSVTQPPSEIPDNRTDYVSTEGTPYAATYDSTHNFIFSSNSWWNRIDVISNATHTIVKEIPIPAPRGLDITQDNSTVWVTTASQQVFEINTTTLMATRHMLPGFAQPVTPFGSTSWIGYQIAALSDGTLFLAFAPNDCCGYLNSAFWDPKSGIFTQAQFPNSESLQNFYILRTGNGKRLYFIGSTSDGPAFYYDATAHSFTSVAHPATYTFAVAVNFDGSKLAIYDFSGLNLYDGDFNLLGPLPGGGVLSTYVGSAMGIYEGGLIFSPDNQFLYQVSMPFNTPVIYKIDTNTRQAISIAPAMPMIPIDTELLPPFFMASPFAVDSTGMLLSTQDYGIAFDDSTFVQNLNPQIPSPVFLQHMLPYSGPISGGTTSGGFGNAFSITPSVWYGLNRGTGALESNSLSITSPPATIPGPVNIKMIFPDGIEIFNPLFFSYGPSIEHVIFSGSSPSGGAVGQILGFGLDKAIGGSVAIGNSQSPITSSKVFGPFADGNIGFTIPPGPPGRADITVRTPDGSATAARAMFYAQSATDYPSNDTFAAILYDRRRSQLYLSAGDHIDVFSLISNKFTTPLNPPAIGGSREFAGLALSPDGSLLFATDLLDGSLAVINPDNPVASQAIFISAPMSTPVNGPQGLFICTTGPLYAAATVNNHVYVASGGLPGPACGPGEGSFYDVDLTSKTVGPGTASLGNCTVSPALLATNGDGSKLAISGPGEGSGTFCIYDLIQHIVYNSGVYQSGSAFSFNGNVAASQWFFTDSTGIVTGSLARPDALYDSGLFPLMPAKLNDTGSLEFVPFPPSTYDLGHIHPTSFFDIIDVHHGMLMMRFSLSETISSTADSLAIDSEGRYIYLLTNQGLTIVDLGHPLLAIGTLSANSAATGNQVTIYGSGFTASTSATVGGYPAGIKFIDQETITITIPSLAPGPADVVLSNSDGTSYVLQSGLEIQ
jgi:hypothetical protein